MRRTDARAARAGIDRGAGPLSRLLAALRAIIGVPDYARYLAHQRAKHPDATPLSREQFARERERARYEGTGSRCC
jgi:uncharacterized short protein YbdD (DUF466 family)